MFQNLIGFIFLLVGFFFILTSIIGYLRFSSFLNKIHASSVSDSLGFPLCYIGVAIIVPSGSLALKVIMLMLITFITGPTICHILAKSYMNKNGGDLDAR